MDILFPDKSVVPDVTNLKAAISDTYPLWLKIVDYVHDQYPKAVDDWHYPGVKYGWSFRIKDKKRAIVYLIPKDNYFKAALVFGGKAMDAIRNSNVSKVIIDELENAKVYAEGRGIRIDVKDESVMDDILRLIEIKLTN